MSQSSASELRQKLEAERDTVPWSALVRHFAFGRVYIVRHPWDLLDAALALHQDAAATVKEAMQRKELEQPTDAEAKAWMETGASFDMLVISPFVLIQATNERRSVPG